LDSRETLDAVSPEKWIHVKQIMPDEASGGTTNSNRVSDARARSGSAHALKPGRTDGRIHVKHSVPKIHHHRKFRTKCSGIDAPF
jgi:hypothetical protein